jgi:N-acetylmuramoyl-L-alanine amidase
MNIRVIECPKNKYDIKCPYEMKAELIAVHNTYNDASAENEITYMHRNDNLVSFHYAVDDKEAIQGLPLNRNGFHAGDGAFGNGNRSAIAIEICYSKSGGERFDKAEINATKLIAKLLHERNWGIERVKKHQDFDGKNCPHRTLAKGWARFLNMVQAELNVLKGKPTEKKKEVADPNRSTGALFTCTGLWTQANGGKWYPSSQLLYGKGDYTIGKVHKGAKHPYEALKNGAIVGFANDKCIDDEPTLPSGVASAKKTLSVGMKATPITRKSYEGVTCIAEVTQKRWTVIDIKGNRVVLGDGLNTAFHIDNLKY